MELDLFLGVKISPQLEAALDILSKAASFYFDNSLKIILHNEEKYLGKNLPSILQFEDLDSQERHVISLIKQIIPSFNAKQTSLVLLTVLREQRK